MNLSSIDQLSRHPLLLALVGGIVTGYLIPLLTKRWQDFQKAIETRTRFASETTELVFKLILAVQLAERNAMKPEDYNKAYFEWEVKRAILGSQIRGYFQNPQLALDWLSLSEEVTKIYTLSGTWNEPYRSEVLGSIKATSAGLDMDWEALSNYQLKNKSNDDFQRYSKAWWAVRESLIQKTGDFTKKILEAKTTSFL